MREELIANNSTSNITGSSPERNELVYGEENVIGKELRFLSSTKKRIDTCMDNSRPSLATGIEPIKNSFLDAKRRGVKLRSKMAPAERSARSRHLRVAAQGTLAQPQ